MARRRATTSTSPVAGSTSTPCMMRLTGCTRTDGRCGIGDRPSARGEGARRKGEAGRPHREAPSAQRAPAPCPAARSLPTPEDGDDAAPRCARWSRRRRAHRPLCDACRQFGAHATASARPLVSARRASFGHRSRARSRLPRQLGDLEVVLRLQAGLHDHRGPEHVRGAGGRRVVPCAPGAVSAVGRRERPTRRRRRMASRPFRRHRPEGGHRPRPRSSRRWAGDCPSRQRRPSSGPAPGDRCGGGTRARTRAPCLGQRALRIERRRDDDLGPAAETFAQTTRSKTANPFRTCGSARMTLYSGSA